MMASQRGWSIEEPATKLLEVSAKAQERARLHDEGYALITAQNAAAAAAASRGIGDKPLLSSCWKSAALTESALPLILAYQCASRAQ
jgi:hypothetical protein